MTPHPFPSIAIDDLPADIPAILERLADTHPTIAMALVRALEGADALALRTTANRLLETLANDSRLDQEVDAGSHCLRASVDSIHSEPRSGALVNPKPQLDGGHSDGKAPKKT